MQTMHLFAGIGGGLLADRILGHEPVVAVEWEPYACHVLRERAAEGWFPGLRVWEGDVRLFDPSEYAGRVDCIHAGFPCQDLSAAGKREGLGVGTRSGLYSEALRISRQVRPKYIFLENVAAIVSRGVGTVLGDLAEMGYDAKWACIPASFVGAPHKRDRWWCLATDSKRDKQPREEPCGGEIGRVGREQQSIPWDSAWEGALAKFRGMDDGASNILHRCDGIRNAQVPLQAAVAWRLLGGE